MKIEGTSSYITVEIDGKTVKIHGEMVVGGFVAYADTIKNWEPPFDNIKIDEPTKSKIIDGVLNKIQNSDFKTQFE